MTCKKNNRLKTLPKFREHSPGRPCRMLNRCTQTIIRHINQWKTFMPSGRLRQTHLRCNAVWQLSHQSQNTSSTWSVKKHGLLPTKYPIVDFRITTSHMLLDWKKTAPAPKLLLKRAPSRQTWGLGATPKPMKTLHLNLKW